MDLALQKHVTKVAVDHIYDNAMTGMTGHFIVLFLTALLFFNKIPHEIIALGVVVHIILLARRAYLRYTYLKIRDTITDIEEINHWLSKYRRCMFLSGLAFGLMIFFFQHLSIEYHFLILTIIIGLSAGGLYTLGEVFSIYLSYALAMLVTALIWMLLQDAYIYTIGTVLILVAIYYYLSSARRYAKNFKQIIIEKHLVEEYINKQKFMQGELHKQKDNLEYQASHDYLTGLPNRILFNDRLNQCIEKAKRTNTQIALFFIDLDHFKEINDSLGHNVGDEVLKIATTRLQSVIRKEDTLARLGGDEFTIIMENLKDSQVVIQLAQKILEVLIEPISLNSHKLYISSSIGISLYPQDNTDADNLLQYADAAMYKAKAEGRNNFKFYSEEMTVMALERVIMTASLKQAILREEFVVYYQAQMDAKNEKLIGMEALVRWKHPSLGLVSPARFIPLAEETGLIIEIDNMVMKIAMKQVSEWYLEGLNPGVLSLNLAIKQLGQDGCTNILSQIMSEYNYKSEWLELEITEGDIMKKADEAIIKLQKISDLGVKIAIDDFGTGYSSLSYLKKLPIDKLKIDQSFIRDIPGDEDDDAIVKAVIAISKSLNLDVIAEGVETKEQKEFVLENGCSKIQGYYYCRPIPSSEMQKMLESYKV